MKRISHGKCPMTGLATMHKLVGSRFRSFGDACNRLKQSIVLNSNIHPTLVSEMLKLMRDVEWLIIMKHFKRIAMAMILIK